MNRRRSRDRWKKRLPRRKNTFSTAARLCWNMNFGWRLWNGCVESLSRWQTSKPSPATGDTFEIPELSSTAIVSEKSGGEARDGQSATCSINVLQALEQGAKSE